MQALSGPICALGTILSINKVKEKCAKIREELIVFIKQIVLSHICSLDIFMDMLIGFDGLTMGINSGSLEGNSNLCCPDATSHNSIRCTCVSWWAVTAIFSLIPR